MANFRAGARISGGDDYRAAAVEGLIDGQLLRSGIPTHGLTLSAAAQDFSYETLPGLARQSLEWANEDVRGMESHDLVRKALKVSDDINRGRREGQRDQTFTGLLENVYSKVAMATYFRVSQSWRRWCSISKAKDFKRATRAAFTDQPVLELTGEHGEIKTVQLAARAEYQTVATRAGIIRVPREALVNDDLDAFVAAARYMGETADGTVNAAVYSSLTSAAGVGPTLLSTGAALFSSTHGNYATSGAAPSVTTLNAARKAMRTRTDPETARALNVAAKYLIVPPSLESTARILAGSDAIPNHPENLEVIVEAALESASNGTQAWYLAGDQNLVPTYDVAFLGDPVPTFDQKYNWDVDALEYRARLDMGVAPLDYRAIYRNIGV